MEFRQLQSLGQTQIRTGARLMQTLYLLQTFIPLALIGWIAIAPQRSAVGFWTQAVATGLGLVAISFVGVWLFPPWWTPYAFGVLLIAAIAIGLRRRALVSALPKGVAGWIASIGFAALGVFAANETHLALAASQLPAGRTVDLAWPLGPGRYLVANGGATLSLNAHADALDQSIPAHRPWHGTAYGVDLVAIDSTGFRADGMLPKDPRRYRIFGAQVVAPCAGSVIVAVDGLPDMQVPVADEQHLAGNHVILRCGDVDIVLGHFRQGSVRARLGEKLAVDAPIGEVGNSGASSETHLHIHAQAPGTPDAPLSGAPIPMTFEGRYLVRNSFIEISSRGG